MAELKALIAEVHRRGGILIANHPTEHNSPWRYEWARGIDAVEVWNGPWLYRDDVFQQVGINNHRAIRVWDALLNARAKVPAVGGSDSHWRSTAFVQGVGQPTTWVYAASRRAGDILAAIRAGRTFVSAQPRLFGGPSCSFHMDADRDGIFEGLPGAVVRGPGPVPVLVRVRRGTGLVLLLVANGEPVAVAWSLATT